MPGSTNSPKLRRVCKAKAFSKRLALQAVSYIEVETVAHAEGPRATSHTVLGEIDFRTYFPS